MHKSLRRLLLSLGIPLLLGMAGGAQARGDYLLATASTGGTYYPVGVALATLVKVKLQATHGINLSAINSGGSAENIKLLRDNEAQFGFLLGLYGVYAWQGSGPLAADGPQRELRSVSMVWRNVEHFTARAGLAPTGTIMDVRDIDGVAGFGNRNSGSMGSSRAIFANLGIDIDAQFDLFYGGYGALAGAMQDGKADLIGTPAGVPVSAITMLFSARTGDFTLLGFTDDQARRADGGLGLWTPYKIPAGTYPGQDRDVTTIAQPNFMVARAEVPADDIYIITRTLYENLGFLRAIHKATEAMALDQAIGGLPIPLHPGAIRYYREAGLTIPARLLPDDMPDG